MLDLYSDVTLANLGNTGMTLNCRNSWRKRKLPLHSVLNILLMNAVTNLQAACSKKKNENIGS